MDNYSADLSSESDLPKQMAIMSGPKNWRLRVKQGNGEVCRYSKKSAHKAVESMKPAKNAEFFSNPPMRQKT